METELETPISMNIASPPPITPDSPAEIIKNPSTNLLKEEVK